MASHSGRSQTAFARDDNFDIQGVHTLWVPSDPNNFNPVIISNSDFRRFKLHIIRSRLTLGPRAICNRYRVDMNNDGTWEQGWTNSNEITISFFYPNPPDGRHIVYGSAKVPVSEPPGALSFYSLYILKEDN
jgi:hypothetical protein